MKVQLEVTNPDIDEVWKNKAKQLLEDWINSLAVGINIKSLQEAVFTNSVIQKQSSYNQLGYQVIYSTNEAVLLQKQEEKKCHVLLIPLLIINRAFYQKDHLLMDQTLLALLCEIHNDNNRA